MSAITRRGHEDLVEQLTSKMTLSQLPRARPSQNRTPKRHSLRIEKPRTPKASPRVFTERRKTFTGNSTKPYPSLADHYQAMYGSSTANDEAISSTGHLQNARPLSWHPASSQGLPGFTSSPASDYGYAYAGSIPNQDQITYSPYEQYLPYPSELTHPHQSWFPDVTSYSTTPQASTTGWPTYMSESLSYTSDYNYTPMQYPPVYAASTTTFPQGPIPVVRSELSRNEVAAHPVLERIETAKALEVEDRLAREPSQELVGMGLYDEPGLEPILSGLTGGKTLKLEESWAPPDTLVSDDEEDEHEDDEQEEASPVEPAEPAKPALLSHSISTQAPQLSTINLSNQSFLFDDDHDDTIATNDWWYQQSKQVAVSAPAAGYGYSYGYDWYRA